MFPPEKGASSEHFSSHEEYEAQVYFLELLEVINYLKFKLRLFIYITSYKIKRAKIISMKPFTFNSKS